MHANEASDPTPSPSNADLDLTRRDFSKTGLLAAGAAMLPAALVPSPADARSNAELAYLPAVEQLQRFRSRQLSPVDVLRAQIQRIETLNPAVNCVTFEHFDEALEAAKASENRYAQGNPLPLDGLSVAVKDEHDHVGWVTTMGSLLFADNPPATDNAAIIDMLLEAGAVLHIQTTVPEFYLAGTTWTRLWGITRNPWDRQFTPGGSSGGSATALAAGFTTLATGSDMGGSIRIPASQCGLYGFKPPFGRVPTSEVAYETSGPLARSFQDLRLMQQIISGPSWKVHSSLRPKLDYPEQFPDVRGFKVAVDFATHISELDVSVSDAMAEAVTLLRQLGCSVEAVDLGFNFKEDFPTFARGLLSTSTGSLIVAAALQPELLTRYVATFVDNFLGDAGPVQALVADELIKKHHQAVQTTVFRSGFQALLMPTMTTPFVPADYQFDPSKDFFFTNGKPLTGQQFPATFPWNLMGRYPVVNVPIGRASNNVPLGLQIIANTFDDLTAFQLAAAYSAITTPFFTNGNLPDFRMS